MSPVDTLDPRVTQVTSNVRPSKTIDLLARFLTRRCRPLAVLCILSAIVPAMFLPSLRVNNSIEVWADRSGEQYGQYQAFLERYGSEEFVVVALDMDDPLEPRAMALQSDLALALGQLDGVAEVLSLPGILELSGFGPAAAELLGSQSYLKNYLIGHDGRTAGLIAGLRSFPDPADRQRTVEAVDAVVARLCKDASWTYHLAGLPLLTARLNQAAHEAMKTFLMIAAALALVVLLLCLRSWLSTVAVITAVAVTVIWTMGLMAMAGTPVNMITAVLPTLLFVLTLSNGIHLALEYSRNLFCSTDVRQVLDRTFRTLLSPVILASVTTAVGFGSLIISRMQPVSETGLYASVGISIGCVCNLLIVPGLLAILKPVRPRNTKQQGQHWSANTASYFAHRSVIVTFLAAVALAVCSMLALQLDSESNVLTFFPSDSRVVRDYRFIGERLTGFYTVELDVLCGDDEAQVLGALGVIGNEMAEFPNVVRVDHLGRIEQLKSNLRLTILGGGPGLTPEAKTMIDHMSNRLAHTDSVGRHLRLSVMTSAVATSDFFPIVDRLRESATGALPDECRWNVTGLGPLMKDAQRLLVSTQIRSFPLATGIILLLIGVLFRSARVFAASILPNLLPIIGTFALMALLGIPLDPATVMIASVAIGLAADNTIHFLARYRFYVQAGQQGPAAAALSFGVLGRAAVYTSIVAATGFGVLYLSEFRPVALFGLLTSTTILAALASDMIVLPACASLFRLWQRSSPGLSSTLKLLVVLLFFSLNAHASKAEGRVYGILPVPTKCGIMSSHEEPPSLKRVGRPYSVIGPRSVCSTALGPSVWTPAVSMVVRSVP